MHEVAWIGPLPSQPGLVEYESCLYLTSEILPPDKGPSRGTSGRINQAQKSSVASDTQQTAASSNK
jgi:hypothetical protein